MWTLTHDAIKVRERQRELVNAQLAAKNADLITEVELDRRCFNQCRFGGPVKWEFLIRCWNHHWPDFFQIENELEGVKHVNYWHVRMAKALCKFKRVIMLGCASSGKSFVSGAAYPYIVWSVEPDGTSVYMSTTSAESGESRAWGAIKDLHSKDVYQIGKRIDSLRVITLDEEVRNEEGQKERDYRNSLRAVLIKPGSDGKNVMGSIVGRKNRRVIWACDELPFMDIGVLDARVNLFSNAGFDGFAQFIGLGNAPEEGDPMYIDAEPVGEQFPDGWRSVDKDVHEGWPTKTGYCLYFNGAKSPNMRVPKGKRPPFNRIMDWNSMEEILKTAGGEDTPMFWKQFYGFPPTVDVPDKVITYKLLEKNRAFEKPEWLGAPKKTVAGLDLGFRKDGDPCVIDFAMVGDAITKIGDASNPNPEYKKVAGFETDGIVLNPSQKDARDFETQIARRAIEECRARNCHDLALDVTGDGGILLQAIEREARNQSYALNVVPVSFSGTADDLIVVPGEKRTAREMFDRKVSQIWTSFRLAVQNGVVRGCVASSKAVTQLCSRRYSTDEKKRFTVEKKEDMKKRLKRSPDHADARCLALFMALKMGLSGATLSPSAQMAKKREEFEANFAPQNYSEHDQTAQYSEGF